MAASRSRDHIVLIIGLSLVLLTGSLAARADAVWGKVFPMKLADGSVIQVRVWGDEYYRTIETLDGYTLTPDPTTGEPTYAALSEDGTEFVSTGVAVGETDPATLGVPKHLRLPASVVAQKVDAVKADMAAREFDVPLAPPTGQRGVRGPTMGAVEGLCLIIDFDDDPGTVPPQYVADFCNEPGFSRWSNNGSVRDYYYDVSDGLLTYTNWVPTAYYRAQHPKSYYTDPSISFGTRARELIVEALDYLDAQGMDFSQFDANGDGVIDALNCFYAGYRNSQWSVGLWPHSWSVYWCADGVCTSRYQITDMENALSLQTFCHENGHMLMRWPDLYDYDYDSTGVGRFCLMCYGTSSTNPCEPCAYMKYLAGWATTIELTTPESNLAVPAGINTIYKYPHPWKSYEYYLIENRQQSGRDRGLPDAGLAVWHIDEFGSNNDQQRTPSHHYECTLVQADGRWDFENNRNTGDSTDLWAAPSYTVLTPETSPATTWWDGSLSDLHLLNISEVGETMTFTFATAPCQQAAFTQQPAAMVRDCEGGTISLSVAVDLPNVAFQWYRGSEPLVDDAEHVIGATDATLTLVGITQADESNDYRCRATNLDEDCTSWSTKTWVMVDSPPTIAASPIDVTGTVGDTLVLSVAVDRAEPLFQWYRDGEPLSNGDFIYGTQNRNLVFQPAQVRHSGTYTCVVTDEVTGCSTTSEPATLVVTPGDGCRGDFDCDGDRDFMDIDYLLAALGGQADWEQYYRSHHADSAPTCEYLYNADVDGQGDGTTFFDIDAFLDLLGTPCP